MTKTEALKQARDLSANGRKHVVRVDIGGAYHVCPLYVAGREGFEADLGYSAFGVLVKESMQ